ncbi:MAG: hypothetical protein IPK13_07255 [Deltaproteobacteria bacterium]|nr:hypothetical protein [Deltaproteobacteria bacterium]
MRARRSRAFEVFVVTITMCAAHGGLAGCHAPLSNDDILFLMSLPRDLEVDIPTNAASTRALTRANLYAHRMTTHALLDTKQSLDEEMRPLATYYLDAKQGAERINQDILSPLEVIDRISEVEPTFREDDQRTWGPIPAASGSMLLSVERVRTATVFEGTSTSTAVSVDEFFRYSIIAAPRGAETWTPILWGVFAPVEAPDQGLGVLYVDFSAIRLVDPDSADEGVYITAYDTRPQQRTLEVLWSLRTLADPDVAYRYHRDDIGGRGEFVFVNEVDVDQRGKRETVTTVARWLALGPGRADVIISDGDLGPFVGWARECWDAAFLRTYFESNLPDTDETFGHITDCPTPFVDGP